MNKHVVTDASDEEQVKRAQNEEQDRDRDIAAVMSTPRGRRWMYELIYVKCHVLRPSMTMSDRDITAFNEGARSVGLTLLEEVKQHPAQYFKMHEENFDGPV